MALYRPPTAVSTRQFPYLALVSQTDPDFQRRKHREIEYDFPGHVKLADPTVRGSYNNHSNSYAVGQQFGADDPLVTANKAPTVGNATPGLYSGVPDGKGWA